MHTAGKEDRADGWVKGQAQLIATGAVSGEEPPSGPTHQGHTGEKAVVNIFCIHYQHAGSVPLTKGFGVPLSLRLGGPRHSCVHVKCTVSLRTLFIQDFSVPYTGETVKGAGEMIRLVNIFRTRTKT